MKKLSFLAMVVILAASVPLYASSLCSVDGSPVACNTDNNSNGSVTLGTYHGSSAYALTLANPDNGGTPNVFIATSDIPASNLLGNTVGLFEAYVPTQTYQGEPYMYYTVYNGTSIFDGYALVIAANSGFTAATDSWYQDGLIATSTVHLVFGDGWTPANMGITNSDWTTCCSDLPTLAQLDSVVIPGMGGEDWGGLSIYKARVAIGDSGSGTPGYTADISSVELNPPVVTPEGGSGNLYLLLAGMACFAAMFLGRRWGSVSAPAN